MFAQWFHLYELDDRVADLVVRTYSAAFPHVALWFTRGDDVLLLGLEDPARASDLRAIEQRFRRADFGAGFRRAKVSGFAELLAHEQVPAGVFHSVRLQGRLHTLEHPLLSHLAARAFFVGQRAPVPKVLVPRAIRTGVGASLLRRYARARGGMTQEVFESATSETCGHRRLEACATFLAGWRRAFPGSERLAAALSKARARAAARSGRTPPADLSEAGLSLLGSLFGPPPPATTPISPKRALAVTEAYQRYFQYALPFDARTLAAYWARCSDPACRIARLEAESRLGPLPAPTGAR